jgi:hypothetical protein
LNVPKLFSQNLSEPQMNRLKPYARRPEPQRREHPCCKATMILMTQRRDDEMAMRRDQMTLELAILSEQKSAKIIALL